MADRSRHCAGFTLLELLVATAMTAVLAGSLYATLHVAFKARRSAMEIVAPARKAELAVELLRQDLTSAVVPKGLLAGEFVGEDATSGTGLDSDTVELYAVADGGQEVDGTGDIRWVQIGCDADEDTGGMVLFRKVERNLLSTRVEDPDPETICGGVRSFNLRYFDGLEWTDGWESVAEDATLPRAIEVTLELLKDDDADVSEDGGYWVSRVFQIPCSSVQAGIQIEAEL